MKALSPYIPLNRFFYMTNLQLGLILLHLLLLKISSDLSTWKVKMQLESLGILRHIWLLPTNIVPLEELLTGYALLSRIFCFFLVNHVDLLPVFLNKQLFTICRLIFLYDGKIVWQGMTHEFTTSTNPIVQQVITTKPFLYFSSSETTPGFIFNHIGSLKSFF